MPISHWHGPPGHLRQPYRWPTQRRAPRVPTVAIFTQGTAQSPSPSRIPTQNTADSLIVGGMVARRISPAATPIGVLKVSSLKNKASNRLNSRKPGISGSQGLHCLNTHWSTHHYSGYPVIAFPPPTESISAGGHTSRSRSALDAIAYPTRCKRTEGTEVIPVDGAAIGAKVIETGASGGSADCDCMPELSESHRPSPSVSVSWYSFPTGDTGKRHPHRILGRLQDIRMRPQSC